MVESVLIGWNGWQASHNVGTFNASNPATSEKIGNSFPISSDRELNAASRSVAEAFRATRQIRGEVFAAYLGRIIEKMKLHTERLIKIAMEETGFTKAALRGEIVRTTDQLEQAAVIALGERWRDRKSYAVEEGKRFICSMNVAAGPALIIIPSNFPFAFGPCGGEFAAATAAGIPCIVQGNPVYPATTEAIIRLMYEALVETTDLPCNFLQMFYACDRRTGWETLMQKNSGIRTVAFTGSRRAGERLLELQRKNGRVKVFAEMEGPNPIILLDSILQDETGQATLAQQLVSSIMLRNGQLCTRCNLHFMTAKHAELFTDLMTSAFRAAQTGTLLSEDVVHGLIKRTDTMKERAVSVLIGGERSGPGFRFLPTLFKLSGIQFLSDPDFFSQSPFGPTTTLVVFDDEAQMMEGVQALSGQLAFSVYGDVDDPMVMLLYENVEAGRILFKEVPTGVAVVPTMFHGGGYPATNDRSETGVGLPGALEKYLRPLCVDRLPRKLLGQFGLVTETT